MYGWLARYREGGAEAVRARPVPGRPPKLSDAHLRRVYALIVGSDPRQLQFAFALWTQGMVGQLVCRQFGVVLSAVSVGRLLHRLGLSPQRPVWRAYQQDEETVRRWKDETFPAIRAEAVQLGATIYFADEAGIRSDDHAGTTWAPVGQTPVVATTGARHTVNMISAVTAAGALRFAVYPGSFTSTTFFDFAHRLLHDTPGPVFLVVDGHPVHRSTAVRQFAASTDGRLRLFFRPGYSPELNPDKWVWKNVKADRVGRTGTTSTDDLTHQARAALHRLQKLPRLIRGFFADPRLRYITT